MSIKVSLLAFILLAELCAMQPCIAKTTIQGETENQSVVLDVQNMTCAMCPITIRKALQGVEGVQSAKVEFARKTANVTFDPENTNIETLIKATTNVGYPATVHAE